jgi:hypothetical protein
VRPPGAPTTEPHQRRLTVRRPVTTSQVLSSYFVALGSLCDN